MGYWSFSNVGYSCIEKNEKNVERLLSCMGIDFDDCHGSEAGEINYMFDKAKMGCNNSTFKPAEIYAIVNRVFENTTIFYEDEEGNNTSDDYSRYEEIYDPKSGKTLIGKKNYSYGCKEVFGKSAYEFIHEECEKAAKEQGIPVKWYYSDPEGEEFKELCESILEEHGGIGELGTKESTEEIPAVSISDEQVMNIVDELAKKRYNKLVAMVKKAFSLEYDSPYMTDSQEEG